MSRRLVRAERREKLKTLLRVVLICIFAALLIGLIYQIGQKTYAAINKIKQGIEPVRWGCIEDTVSTRAIVINNEVALTAEYEGHFENLVKDQEKVSKGTVLGYLVAYNQKKAVNAPIAGIFTTHSDGLEHIFSQLNFQTAGPEIFHYQTGNPNPDNGQAYSGRTFCKVVDNLTPTRLLMQIPLEQLGVKITKNQAVSIRLNNKDLGQANIKEIKNDSGAWIILMELNNCREELIDTRFIDIQAVFGSTYGYIVPQKALVNRGNEKGVYCTQGENTIFKPVKILELNDEKAVVEGLDRNDIIITNAQNVKV